MHDAHLPLVAAGGLGEDDHFVETTGHAGKEGGFRIESGDKAEEQIDDEGAQEDIADQRRQGDRPECDPVEDFG